MLRVPHREATPTSTTTITVHKGAHGRGDQPAHSQLFTWQKFSVLHARDAPGFVLASMTGACVFGSPRWVGGPSLPGLAFSRRLPLFLYRARSTPTSRTVEQVAVRGSGRHQTHMASHSRQQAVHFDSSFSYCSVVDAPAFVFKVHLVHVSGVRWRFN